MLDFSVGDLAGTLGLDPKIAGVDLNKLNLADILGLKKKKKKRLEDEEDDGEKYSFGSMMQRMPSGSIGSPEEDDQYPTTAGSM